jgi:hypothetical protein
MLAVRAVRAVDAAVPAPSPADNRPLPHGRRRSDGLPAQFRRLTAPDERDRAASVLLRHPDLLEPIASMHRDDLLYLLG